MGGDLGDSNPGVRDGLLDAERPEEYLDFQLYLVARF